MFLFLQNIPFAIVSAIISWAAIVWVYREKKVKEKTEKVDRLEEHRDDLMLELLQAARAEVTVAYAEMKILREEMKPLREVEQHLYHFRQALDHLEAVLYAETTDAKASAERSAKAFLKRMRSLKPQNQEGQADGWSS